MYTSEIILLSSKGIITNAIIDLLPNNYGVQQIYFSDEEIEQTIREESAILLKADIIMLNLSEMNVDAESSISTLKQLYPQAAIIVLHLYNQTTFTDAFIKMGASAYLPVNFNSEELLSVLDKISKKKSLSTL